jgi:hypothetical protein
LAERVPFYLPYPGTKIQKKSKRRKTMKTTLRNIAITIGLTAVLGSASLFAQTASKANIPFDFQMTGKTLPAGEYIVKLADNHQMLVFQNVATGHSTMTLVQQTKSGTLAEPILTFRHNGEQYRLESAWFAGVQGGYGPLRGKSDRADTERGMVATIRLLQK